MMLRSGGGMGARRGRARPSKDGHYPGLTLIVSAIRTFALMMEMDLTIPLLSSLAVGSAMPPCRLLCLPGHSDFYPAHAPFFCHWQPVVDRSTEHKGRSQGSKANCCILPPPRLRLTSRRQSAPPVPTQWCNRSRKQRQKGPRYHFQSQCRLVARYSLHSSCV
jgi:hypothetical protein